MKAVLFHHHGGPEVLEYTEFPARNPNPEVIRPSRSLNRMDIIVRNGWQGSKLELPTSMARMVRGDS
jgi:NADPH:quinone reductase-like Zn-dependent oxidoreductase